MGYKQKGWTAFTRKTDPPKKIKNKKDDIVYEGGTLDEIKLTPKTPPSSKRPGESISNWKKRTGLIPWEKGDTPYTKKIDPVKKPVGPVTPATQADYMKREVFNIIEDQKRRDKELDSDKKFDKKYNRANIGLRGMMSMLGGSIEKKKKSPLKQVTDPPKKKKPVDDDTDVMTPKQERKHRREVLKYNKNVSKPMNETQKRKIREQLSKMDPKDPEAKLLRKMLNLKKNR